MQKKSLPFWLFFFYFFGQPWHTNLEEAMRQAKKEHRHILLNFSGSDWCGPCILLRKNILDHPAFLQLADSALVLVNADFPRNKKNQFSPEQQRLNDQMADRYNSRGQFPLTLLLTADGKILKQWEGNPGVAPEIFSADVRASIDRDIHTSVDRDIHTSVDGNK